MLLSKLALLIDYGYKRYTTGDTYCYRKEMCTTRFGRLKKVEHMLSVFEIEQLSCEHLAYMLEMADNDMKFKLYKGREMY